MKHMSEKTTIIHPQALKKEPIRLDKFTFDKKIFTKNFIETISLNLDKNFSIQRKST